MKKPPFLQRVALRPGVELDASSFPGSLPCVRDLDLTFDSDVTIFVGENGSGKSTLIEAIADLCDLPVAGGGRNELADLRAPHRNSELAPYLRAGFARRPPEGYFFRSEFQAHFASLLEERAADPDFRDNPYARYGGQSLHTRSHGEAFLAMFQSWLSPGIILMDEPESALSPQRQLTLLVQMRNLTRRRGVQLIIATHSPILMTFPGARLWSFDASGIAPTLLEETSHYQITRGILEAPSSYWHHLDREDE